MVARKRSPKPATYGPQRVKMSVLSRLSGVPAATIKHYIREGLLPEPKRTSRNMAYYDVGLVDRIRRIKDLQKTRFLPLRVIRGLLDEPGGEERAQAAAHTLARALYPADDAEEMTAADLTELGVSPELLAWLRQLGVLVPLPGRDEETYAGQDLALLRLLRAARRSGLEASMLPPSILLGYVEAIERLVAVEASIFARGVLSRALPSEVPALTEAAAGLSERLVILLRRRLLPGAMERAAKEVCVERSLSDTDAAPHAAADAAAHPRPGIEP